MGWGGEACFWVRCGIESVNKTFWSVEDSMFLCTLCKAQALVHKSLIPLSLSLSLSLSLCCHKTAKLEEF